LSLEPIGNWPVAQQAAGAPLAPNDCGAPPNLPPQVAFVQDGGVGLT